MKIQAEEIFQKHSDLVKQWHLEKYVYIMQNAPLVNVEKNALFQKTFNGFYRVRRNEEWRKLFYAYFEHAKAQEQCFERIITYIFEKTGRIEASFSSKMLATFMPEMPIWDRYVLQNLKLKLSGKTKEEKLKNAILLYERIRQWYEEYLSTSEAKEQLALFDRYLPEYSWLSDVKKIDFMLWSIR